MPMFPPVEANRLNPRGFTPTTANCRKLASFGKPPNTPSRPPKYPCSNPLAGSATSPHASKLASFRKTHHPRGPGSQPATPILVGASSQNWLRFAKRRSPKRGSRPDFQSALGLGLAARQPAFQPLTQPAEEAPLTSKLASFGKPPNTPHRPPNYLSVPPVSPTRQRRTCPEIGFVWEVLFPAPGSAHGRPLLRGSHVIIVKEPRAHAVKTGTGFRN